jgi:hypothetical protein
MLLFSHFGDETKLETETEEKQQRQIKIKQNRPPILELIKQKQKQPLGDEQKQLVQAQPCTEPL